MSSEPGSFCARYGVDGRDVLRQLKSLTSPSFDICQHVLTVCQPPEIKHRGQGTNKNPTNMILSVNKFSDIKVTSLLASSASVS